MGKNIFLIVILGFLIVSDVTSADFSWKVRKLSALLPTEVINSMVTPISSPVTQEKQPSPVVVTDTAKEKQPSPVVVTDKAKEKQDKKATPTITSASTTGEDKSKDKKVENDKGLPPPTYAKEVKTTPKEQVDENKESKPDLPIGINENCDGVDNRCQDSESMIACIKSFDSASSKAWVLLIQNGGDSSLKVHFKTSTGSKKNVVDVAKRQNKKVDIPLVNKGSNMITLNAGHGDCVLQMGAPISQVNYPEWLLSYSKFMTPIYGAYFLLLTTVIVGVVWACCWFRKKKRHTDIPYQELEMSMPESAAAVETAEGWDQGWDDDWDEEKAVKSPGVRNISANGLTSRTPNKDGWEDWDD